MRNPPAWLNTAFFYEVYPQSFYDSNADGIGDLPGVIAKLDYIASLGCNAIWLNPCFESPFQDAGYDVSDFCKVAPRYGTNDDLVRLFKDAHQRGMKVCLDLVAGHTSVEHPWFRQSAQAAPNAFSNRYVWTDSVWHNAPPGLTQVSGHSERNGNYITNFFHFQPALNYGFAKPDPRHPWQLPVDHPDCRATREELKRIMRFWLDLGADGFRVDMAASLVKGDPDGKGTMELWGDIRGMLDSEYPDAVLLAEWSDPSRAVPAGFHIDFLIHFNEPAYTTLFRSEPERDLFRLFPDLPPSFFSREGKGDIRAFLDSYLKHHAVTKGRGYISVPTGNHDIMRLANGRTPQEVRTCLTFLMTLPGVPCLYYGDEIGMDYVTGLVSKEGGYNRTGARTPMQWDRSPNAGFSSAPAERLYLPLDPRPDRPTVAAHEADPESLLQHVRALARVRAAHPALQANAEFRPLYAEKSRYPFVYERRAGGERLIVALNPSGRQATASLPQGVAALEQLGGTKCTFFKTTTRTALEMPPVSCGIFVEKPRVP